VVKIVTCLYKEWSPIQIANQVGISHEMNYRYIYADKAAGGSLYQGATLPIEAKKALCKQVGIVEAEL